MIGESDTKMQGGFKQLKKIAESVESSAKKGLDKLKKEYIKDIGEVKTEVKEIKEKGPDIPPELLKKLQAGNLGGDDKGEKSSKRAASQMSIKQDDEPEEKKEEPAVEKEKTPVK